MTKMDCFIGKNLDEIDEMCAEPDSSFFLVPDHEEATWYLADWDNFESYELIFSNGKLCAVRSV